MNDFHIIGMRMMKMTKIKSDIDYQEEWNSKIDGRTDLSPDEVMEARLEVAENDIMDSWGGTVNEYSELMIQYAFLKTRRR